MHGYGVAEWIHQTSEDVLEGGRRRALSRAASTGVARPALCRMGHFGQQPPREVLLADRRGKKAVGARDRVLAAHVWRSRANSPNGLARAGGIHVFGVVNETWLRIRTLEAAAARSRSGRRSRVSPCRCGKKKTAVAELLERNPITPRAVNLGMPPI